MADDGAITCDGGGNITYRYAEREGNNEDIATVKGLDACSGTFACCNECDTTKLKVVLTGFNAAFISYCKSARVAWPSGPCNPGEGRYEDSVKATNSPNIDGTYTVPFLEDDGPGDWCVFHTLNYAPGTTVSTNHPGYVHSVGPVNWEQYYNGPCRVNPGDVLVDGCLALNGTVGVFEDTKLNIHIELDAYGDTINDMFITCGFGVTPSATSVMVVFTMSDEQGFVLGDTLQNELTPSTASYGWFDGGTVVVTRT